MEAIHELFRSLESINPQVAEDAKNQFHELFISTKDSWLLNGMFDYYLQSGSLRAIDVLICVREPHDRYLFDRLTDSLRGANRLPGLTLLGHVVRRHPLWIYKIASHSVFKELLRVLKSEKDIVILMSALLIVVILLPIIASLISPHLQDLFDIFSHLAVWNTNNPHKVPEGYLIHLEIGMYALFNRLYGMFPCNFLSYLRQHYNSKESLPVFSRTIKPMLDTVRMHPLLVTATKELETSTNRWKKIEANDVIIECSKFSIESNYERVREECAFRSRTSSASVRPAPARPRFDLAHTAIESKQETVEGYVELGSRGVPVVSSFSSILPESSEVWSPAVCSGATSPSGAASIPQTPIIQGCVVSTYSPQGGNSPPEAAIEATPESTPIKEIEEGCAPSVVRSGSSFPTQPGSPLRKDLSQGVTRLRRVQRVISERTQVEVTGKGGAPPPSSPLRLIPTLEQRAGGGPPPPQQQPPPGSPLRLIPQLEQQRHPSCWPAPIPASITTAERTDEDREVEVTFSSLAAPHPQQVTREDSVLGEPTEKSGGDGGGGEGEEEWREWREGGGLRMPEPPPPPPPQLTAAVLRRSSRPSLTAMTTAAARRLRAISHCQSDHFHLPHYGFSTAGSSPKEGSKFLCAKLRKTSSCPDLYKSPKLKREPFKKSPIPIKVRCETSSLLLVSTGSQTEPVQQPLAYEHLLLSVLPPIEQIQQHSAPPDVTSPPTFRDDHIISSPRAALDCYIESTVKSLAERQKLGGLESSEVRQLKEQLILLTLQLQFERHRREVHAERNRRLLGRYRENRVLEEHNSALRDQVQLLQSDIETLHSELNKVKADAKTSAEQHLERQHYWEEKNSNLQRLYKDSTNTTQILIEDLKEEKRKKETISKGYAKLESEVFGLRNLMDDAVSALERAEEVKTELGMLQHHVQAANELELRLRSQVEDLRLTSNKDYQFHLASRAYQQQIREMQKKLDLVDVYREEASEKLKKAETLNSRREEISQEQNRLMEAVRRDSERLIQEKETACREMRELNRERETVILRLQSQVEILEERVRRLQPQPPVAGATPAPAAPASPLHSPSAAAGGSAHHLFTPDETTLMPNLQLLVDEKNGNSPDPS